MHWEAEFLSGASLALPVCLLPALYIHAQQAFGPLLPRTDGEAALFLFYK